MPDRTPRIGLLKYYLEDYADIRGLNFNWDEIDKLFHALDGHKHDGVDSPIIDLASLWEAIEELRRLIAALREDHTSLDIRERLHWSTFLRHNHDGVTTNFFDTFINFDQTDRNLTTAALTPALGLLHLPANYTPNKRYQWVGAPFNLKMDPFPDMEGNITDPALLATRAKCNIIMSRKGSVIPYLVVGGDLKNNKPLMGNPSVRGIYPGAVAGTLLKNSETKGMQTTKYTFEGKSNPALNIPHQAFHHVDTTDLTLSKLSPRWFDNIPFSSADYENIALNDGRTVTTSPKYQDKDARTFSVSNSRAASAVVSTQSAASSSVTTVATPTYSSVTVKADARVLYHDDIPLSWDRKTSNFYWFNTNSDVFTQITKADLGPVWSDDLTEVAANKDEDGWIWILKTQTRYVDNPAGYFDVYHQIVKWDGEKGFEEGQWWRSARMERIHWPKPRILAPTHLEITPTKVAAITHASWQNLLGEDGTDSLVNYYLSNPFYQWFPISNVYGETYKQQKKVTFAVFNPGVLGTVATMDRNSETKVITDNARIISGAYDTTRNKWANLTEADMNAFEGGNDNVYMGRLSNELIFYQSFVPYNGAEVLDKKLYEDEAWKLANPDTAWYGIVKYDVTTGNNTFVVGDMPFKVNTGGGLDRNEATIVGGSELIKQFVIEETEPTNTPSASTSGASNNSFSTSSIIKRSRIVATKDNKLPANLKVIHSFWADRDHQATRTANRISPRDAAINPIKVNVATGASERVNTIVQGANSQAAINKVHSSKVVITSQGHKTIGGKQIQRNAIRPRPTDKPARQITSWKGALKQDAVARQLFYFNVGVPRENDIIKVHYTGRAEGKAPYNPGADTTPDRDILIYYMARGGWSYVGG